MPGNVAHKGNHVSDFLPRCTHIHNQAKKGTTADRGEKTLVSAFMTIHVDIFNARKTLCIKHERLMRSVKIMTVYWTKLWKCNNRNCITINTLDIPLIAEKRYLFFPINNCTGKRRQNKGESNSERKVMIQSGRAGWRHDYCCWASNLSLDCANSISCCRRSSSSAMPEFSNRELFLSRS